MMIKIQVHLQVLMNMLQLQNILPLVKPLWMNDQQIKMVGLSKVLKGNEMPQTNQRVRNKFLSGDWTTAEVLGRAGKAGGGYNDWLNVISEGELEAWFLDRSFVDK